MSCRWSACLFAAAVLSVVQVSYASDASPTSDSPPASLRECNEMRAHGSPKAALKPCTRAYEEAARFDTAAAVAFVYLQLDDRARATPFFKEAARRMPDDVHPEVRAQFQRRLTELGIAPAADGVPVEGQGAHKGLVVAGSVTSVLSLGAGVGLLVAAFSRGGDATEREALVNAAGQTCGAPTDVYVSVCDEVSRNEKAQSQLTVAGGVFVGTAVASAVATVVYTVLAGSDSSTAAITFPPIVPVFISGRPAGAGLQIRF